MSEETKQKKLTKSNQKILVAAAEQLKADVHKHVVARHNLRREFINGIDQLLAMVTDTND